ncbi:MAG: tetratricopeptide repeat protein, partial [Fidelibacterota bacterium]
IKMMVGRLVVNGLTDEGVEYLHKFRNLSGNPQFYSLEMGTYFSLQMSWENSIDEYLNYLSGRSPQFSIVSERILSMPEDENIQSMIRQKLETSPLSDAKFILSDLYFKNREFKKAYDVLISNHASDERLLKFGDDLLFVKEFDLADSVMNNILLTSKDEKVLESAIFKIAQIYEDRTLRSLNLLPISGLFRGNQFFASPFLRIDESQSLAIYKAMSIYDSLKTVTNSIEAAFKLGEIRFRALNDLDGAENQFNELILISGTHPFKLKSFIRTIDILLAKGDLSGAETKITDALKNSSFVRSLGRDANSELEMKLMQVYFYEGKLEELDSLSAIMMKNLPSGNDRVNDILELSGLSISLKNNEDFFNQFAEVQLKIHQNKRTEAIRSLQELTEIEKSPNLGLVYYQYAQLLLLQGETSRTLEMLDLIPGDSPYASLGLIMKGEVEDYILNDLSTSIDTYLLFLEKYPDSIYYDDIRMRLRELAS